MLYKEENENLNKAKVVFYSPYPPAIPVEISVRGHRKYEHPS